jgi:hypothetical protein
MNMPGSSSQAKASCHGEQSSGSDPKSGAPSGFCLTIKTLSSETFPPVLHAPEAPAFLTSELLGLVLFDRFHNVPRPSREGKERNLPLTPEVSLGIANLPLGPPAL